MSNHSANVNRRRLLASSAPLATFATVTGASLVPLAAGEPAAAASLGTNTEGSMSDKTVGSPVTHHTAEVNGIRVHNVTAGSGEAVVLLHGSIDDRHKAEFLGNAAILMDRSSPVHSCQRQTKLLQAALKSRVIKPPVINGALFVSISDAQRMHGRGRQPAKIGERQGVTIMFGSGARIGPDEATLLENVQSTGSISGAARDIGIVQASVDAARQHEPGSQAAHRKVYHWRHICRRSSDPVRDGSTRTAIGACWLLLRRRQRAIS